MKSKSRPVTPGGFDPEAYLESTSPTLQVDDYEPDQVAFSQGDACTEIKYLQRGVIKLSVLSSKGKEAVVAMLAAGRLLR